MAFAFGSALVQNSFKFIDIFLNGDDDFTDTVVSYMSWSFAIICCHDPLTSYIPQEMDERDCKCNK